MSRNFFIEKWQKFLKNWAENEKISAKKNMRKIMHKNHNHGQKFGQVSRNFFMKKWMKKKKNG